MMIGYARVSTDEQNLALQLDALCAVGCDKVFTDHGVSGIAVERDGLAQAINAVGRGDVLVVWKLDRLGRSLGFLIGRRKALSATQIAEARTRIESGESPSETARLLKVGRSTLYRALAT